MPCSTWFLLLCTSTVAMIVTYTNGFLLSHTGFGVLDGGWAEKRQSGSCVLIMKDLITGKVG